METDHLILRETVLRTVTVPEQEANLKYLEQKAVEHAVDAEASATIASTAKAASEAARDAASASKIEAAQSKSDAAVSAVQALAAAVTTTAKASEATVGASTASAAAGTAMAKAAEASVAAIEAGTLAVEATARASEAAASASSAIGNAAAAATAKTVAEAARDAALIQPGLYVDEATGRAAVIDGQAFKVQGAGDVAAFEYRRVNSGTSTLIATYPSAARIDVFQDAVNSALVNSATSLIRIQKLLVEQYAFA